jgi:hypothetical protein
LGLGCGSLATRAGGRKKVFDGSDVNLPQPPPKSSYLLYLILLLCSVVFNRFFGRFVTRGVQKRDKKDRTKFSAAAKKSTYLLTYVTFFLLSTAPPCLRKRPRCAEVAFGGGSVLGYSYPG